MDANKVGDYKLVYSVTNSRGKTTTFTRTVHVQKQAVTPAADKNNGNANGKINGKADNTKEDAEKKRGAEPGNRLQRRRNRLGRHGARRCGGRVDRPPQEGGRRPIKSQSSDCIS